MKQVPVHTLDFLRTDSYTNPQGAFLRKNLERLGLFGEQFGYHAFAHVFLSRVLNTGTHHLRQGMQDSIFVCELDPRTDEIRDGAFTIADYLEMRSDSEGHSAIAIYRLEDLERDVGQKYRFKYPDRKLDALEAVINAVNVH